MHYWSLVFGGVDPERGFMLRDNAFEAGFSREQYRRAWSVVGAASSSYKCLSPSLIAHQIEDFDDNDEINLLMLSMAAANEPSCFHLDIFGHDGSAFHVSPKKMVKKSITKNLREHIELLSKIKTHGVIFFGTDG